MSHPLSVLTVVADTSVLVLVAYLLARGPFLSPLFRDEMTYGQALVLGSALGLAGLLEAFFPDDRFAYATHTLFVTFAAIIGGLPTGLVTASIVSLGIFVSQTPQYGIGTILAVLVGAFLGRSVRRFTQIPARLIGGFVVGALAQACRLAAHSLLAVPAAHADAWISIPANGFGVMLLVLIVTDAQEKARSEQRRLEAERAQTLASEAQLAALRARVHPHFLFNTLNSIAELCAIAPERAETAILRLSGMMRRALDAGAVTDMPLAEELQAAETYLQIEQERLGGRCRVEWQVESVPDHVQVPPFAVQVLVENAINHGLAPQRGSGTVKIVVRRRSRRTLIAVCDDGVGMDATRRRRALSLEQAVPHGLATAQQQLILLHGRRARLRLFSREGVGTMAVFAVPDVNTGLALAKRKSYASPDRTDRG